MEHCARIGARRFEPGGMSHYLDAAESQRGEHQTAVGMDGDLLRTQPRMTLELSGAAMASN
jgi:hypothetical protein